MSSFFKHIRSIVLLLKNIKKVKIRNKDKLKKIIYIFVINNKFSILLSENKLKR